MFDSPQYEDGGAVRVTGVEQLQPGWEVLFSTRPLRRQRGFYCPHVLMAPGRRGPILHDQCYEEGSLETAIVNYQTQRRARQDHIRAGQRLQKLAIAREDMGDDRNAVPDLNGLPWAEADLKWRLAHREI